MLLRHVASYANFAVGLRIVYLCTFAWGRAIFVEPGARHSQSKETIAFLESQKKLDPSWIERDVVLNDLDLIAKSAGFNSGVRGVPTPHPLALQEYSMQEWNAFRNGDKNLREQLTNNLSKLNYDERVIFFIEKT